MSFLDVRILNTPLCLKIFLRLCKHILYFICEYGRQKVRLMIFTNTLYIYISSSQLTTRDVRKYFDTKGVFSIRTSRKDIRYNDQKKFTKRQTLIYKTLHRKLKLEQLKPRGKLVCSGRESSSCSTCGTCRVTLVTNPMYISIS
jgi:hypothetical protein